MRTTENHQVETDSKLYNVLTTYKNINIKKTLLFCLSIIVFWALLIIKIAPSYIAGDSPETIMAFNFLGIQHPPGYALDTLIGKIFLFIPAGNLMFRSAIMAMFFNFMFKVSEAWSFVRFYDMMV